MDPLHQPEAGPRPANPDGPDEDQGPPIEFQPESGALAPVEPVDDAERDRDPRDDL